jgi:Primase X
MMMITPVLHHISMNVSNFKNNMRSLNLAKKKTLTKIQEIFDLPETYSPSIIWSGNGYHLYIPVESNGNILEQMHEFDSYKEPSKLFLRFAECYLSNDKSDSEHYHTVSFKNCLLRIPGSYNSKNMSQVIIVEKWDGISRIQLDRLYSRFLAYLIDQGSKVIKHDYNKTHTFLSENSKSAYVAGKNPRLLRKKSIHWIERLLQTPLQEHRKYCIWRILAPYFINVRRLSFDDSYDKIYQWLDMCNQLKELDFDIQTKINDSLNRATNTGYLPISFDNPLKEPRTLKNDNRELYDTIKV